MEIDQFPHPDGVWTWKSFGRRRQATLWIPYLQEVLKPDNRKGAWRLVYQGGAFDFFVKDVDCVLLYGPSGSLPVQFLDDLNSAKVTLLIHRRNLTNPYLFTPTSGRDDADVLTPQIRYRENNIRRVYIAKTLVRERFRSLEPFFTVPPPHYRQLAAMRDLGSVRAWEASHTKRYWEKYFSNLGVPEQHRRQEGELQAALDACSFFLFGVILRWILLHRLSPCHGYLHQPSGYPSLVYDLIEPYRYIMEKAVAEVAPQKPKDLTAAALEHIKKILETHVYVGSSHQWVRRKNLLHGAVLALRAYLVGDMPRLLLPVEGKPSPGRPPKISYQLAGRKDKPPPATPSTNTDKKKPPPKQGPEE